MNIGTIDPVVIEATKRSILDDLATMTKEEYDLQNEELLSRLFEGEDVSWDIYELNAKLFYKMITRISWPALAEPRDLENIAYECAMTAILSLADEADPDKFTIQYLATACYQQALIILEKNYSPSGVKVSHYGLLKGTHIETASLDYESKTLDGDDVKFVDFMHTKNRNVKLPGNKDAIYNLEDAFCEEEDRRTIAKAITLMPSNKQYVLQEYCGFSTGSKRTFEDIARDLATSRDSVRRLYLSAIEDIRTALHIYVKDDVYHPCNY